jgi:hypothetical protein
MDEVLEVVFPPMISVINNVLDLVFLLSGDKVRRWPHVIWSMHRGFAIRGQQGGMEDVMDGPGHGELEFVHDW